MATRATYEITGTTFYCHWDGYPSGAATRFAAMVAAATVADSDVLDVIEDRRGGWPFHFIRGVKDAEPTEGRDAHGDTEYHYTLTSGPDHDLTIKVEKRVAYKSDGWATLYSGPLVPWLDAMRVEYAGMIKRGLDAGHPGYADADPEADALEAIPVVVRVAEPKHCGYGMVWHATKAEAEKIAEHLAKSAARFMPDNPNKAIYEGKAAAWAAAVTGEEKEAA